jgi:hypothetical protein
MQDHYPIAEFSANLPDRLSYIRIIGDDHRRIKRFVEGVDQQPRRKIDVRALLLDFDDLHQRRRRRRGRGRNRMEATSPLCGNRCLRGYAAHVRFVMRGNTCPAGRAYRDRGDSVLCGP